MECAARANVHSDMTENGALELVKHQKMLSYVETLITFCFGVHNYSLFCIL